MRTIATKTQGKEALDKIREIVAGLGSHFVEFHISCVTATLISI